MKKQKKEKEISCSKSIFFFIYEGFSSEYRIKSIKNGIIIVEKVYIEAGKNEVLEIFYMVNVGGVYNIYKANVLMDILKTHLTYINTEVQKLME